MNISKSNVTGKCDRKCAYSFDYPETSLIATNNDSMISLQCDKSSSPPVTFNNRKYNVEQIVIIHHSIQKFDNNYAPAQFIVKHNPVEGGNALWVALPIINSTFADNNDISTIINEAASKAPNNGETATINISGFTLNDIIPNKPFYSYTDSDNSIDWVIFAKSNALTVTEQTLQSLKNIISKSSLTSSQTNLFENPLGPNSNSVGNGIYISCQPTGSSEQTTPVEYSKTNNSASISMSSIKSLLYYVLAIIATVLLMYGVYYLLSVKKSRSVVPS